MNPLLASHLFEYALNTLWQLPLLAASTWLLIRLARPSVALQHTLWIASLVLAATLPLRTAITDSSVPHSSAASSSRKSATSIASPSNHAPLHLIQLTPSLILHIAQFWSLALAFNLLRLVYAWIAARRLIASSKPLDPEALDPAILQMCADLLQMPTPEVRLTPSSTPVVASILKPVLLLPIGLTHHYELSAALLHEFAHIRRRDTFANLLCRLIALPIAWHPVTPLLHTRIAQTREILCDALAAQATGSPTLYARSLLTLSRDLQPLNQPCLTQGLFPNSSKPSALEERIMTLITPRTITPANRAMRIATGVAVVLIATAIASSFHLKPAHAQAATPLPTELTASRTSATTPQPPVWKLALKSGAYLDKKDGKTWHLTLASAHQLPAPPSPPESTEPLPPLPALAPVAPMPPAPLAPLPPLPAISPAAPQAAPSPIPTPAPAPKATPAPHSHHMAIVNGVQRDLTPAESAEIDKQLAEAQEQIHKARNQKFFDEKALAAQLKALNSSEVQRQIADAQKQINSPEFRQQIDEASRLAADKAVNSQEFRHQMDQAMQQVKIARANLANQKLDIHIDQAQLQQQLKAASKAIANTRINIHIDTTQIQKQLEAARKQLEEARRSNQ